MASSDIFKILPQIHGILVGNKSPFLLHRGSEHEDLVQHTKTSPKGGSIDENVLGDTSLMDPGQSAPETSGNNTSIGTVVKQERADPEEESYFGTDGKENSPTAADTKSFIGQDELTNEDSKQDVQGAVASINKPGQMKEVKGNKTKVKTEKKKRKYTQRQPKEKEKTEKIWQCSICQLLCPSNAHLIIHTRRHTG